jgi:hypothetical protein
MPLISSARSIERGGGSFPGAFDGFPSIPVRINERRIPSAGNATHKDFGAVEGMSDASGTGGTC